MNEVYLTVSALNDYLYYKFDNDLNLRSVYLKAEISDLRYSKGYLFFSLKDSNSEINAVMFTQALMRLKFEPQDGMTVLVNGKVSVYKKKGTYSLTVYQMEKAGLGENYLKFLRLKEKLMQEGLFDVDKKLPVPLFSCAVGVITSKTGDALRDIKSTIRKRFPLTKIIVYDAIVQGASAPQSLINAICKANEEKKTDCLIIARGGGSDEDLSCFNDEALARAIFASKIPTVSGVGHETDFTICDFVASKRAPTPTGAADAVTPDAAELILRINQLQKRLHASALRLVHFEEQNYYLLLNRYGKRQFLSYLLSLQLKVNDLSNLLNLNSPKGIIEKTEFALNNLHNRLMTNIKKIFMFLGNIVKSNQDKLELLNPLNVMQKGYAVIYHNDVLIASSNDLKKDDEIMVAFYDGTVDAKVTEKREK